jgi:hypothetical protein
MSHYWLVKLPFYMICWQIFHCLKFSHNAFIELIINMARWWNHGNMQEYMGIYMYTFGPWWVTIPCRYPGNVGKSLSMRQVQNIGGKFGQKSLFLQCNFRSYLYEILINVHILYWFGGISLTGMIMLFYIAVKCTGPMAMGTAAPNWLHISGKMYRTYGNGDSST